MDHLHTTPITSPASLWNSARIEISWVILRCLVEILCEQASRLWGRETGVVKRHSISESSPTGDSSREKSTVLEKIVWLCAAVINRMLCCADSAAVASNRAVCFSITLTVTVLSLAYFHSGANQHSTGNVQPNGTFRSVMERQYWIFSSEWPSRV